MIFCRYVWYFAERITFQFQGGDMFSLASNFQVGRPLVLDITMPCGTVFSEFATVGNIDDEIVSLIFSSSKGFFLTKPATADIRIECQDETVCYRATIIPNTALPFVTARIEDRIRTAEKRRYHRTNSWLPVHCLYDAGIDSPPRTVSGKMNVNISAGGIRIRLPEQLPKGKNVVLSVGLPVGPEMMSILAQTVYSRFNEPTGSYLTAFEYTFIADEDRREIDDCVDRLDAGRKWQERDRTLFRYEMEGGNCLKAVLKGARII
jgi:c-di-GMP-binding flagellar brake protein YcgR